MTRLPFIAAAVALPLSTSAAAPAEGRIETDQGHIEILSRPLRAGDRIELPEGFLQVEEDGPEDGEVGSFGVIPVESFATPGPVPAEIGSAGVPPPPPPAAPPCTAERSAYLAELWKQSGIEEAPDPVALLEGLQGGVAGSDAGFYWFVIATDPFRPLAWSSDLRDRADALVRCVRGQ